MSEKHITSFEYFDLEVEVTDDGDVSVAFRFPESVPMIGMDWHTLREVIEFVGVHGLSMKEPYFVEYAETVEGAAELAEARA